MLTEPTELLADRYRLDGLIGRGGMADVHRATDTVLEREVAVKLLRMHAASERDRARFRDEATLLAALDHPHLVAVLDAGLAEDVPYLVMELVDGQSLARFCAGSPVPGHRVAAIGAELASVLGYVHERGIVHRDVKPSNILLGRDGRVRLADFGIARMMGDTTGHTATGTTIGTAAYIAPEQVRGEAVSPASDVYSLGLVLLEALTGRRAYTGGPLEAALARLTAAPVIPTSLPTGWPALITQMTDVDPANRPSGQQVAQVLIGLGQPDAPRHDRRATDLAAAPALTSPAPPAPPGSVAQAPTPAPARGRSSCTPEPATRPGSARAVARHRARRSRTGAVVLAGVLVGGATLGGLVLAGGTSGDTGTPTPSGSTGSPHHAAARP